MSAEETFPPSSDQVREARRFVAAHVPPALAHDAALVVSELVTNAIEHAATPVLVRVLDGDDRVRVEVQDSSAVLPAVGDLLGNTERGRGLHIVERLTNAWGVRSDESGKTIWFELRRHASDGDPGPGT